jgi:hypothetical protein
MKHKRDTFLYMEGNIKDFAQCSSCIMWLSKRNKCMIHSESVKIDGDDSCGLYVQGAPREDGTCLGLVTPKESGLVDRQVRCENCFHFGENKCGLFDNLNKKMPDQFDLDINVKPRACCNAQVPK